MKCHCKPTYYILAWKFHSFYTLIIFSFAVILVIVIVFSYPFGNFTTRVCHALFIGGRGEKINQHQNHTQLKSCTILAIHLGWITFTWTMKTQTKTTWKKKKKEYINIHYCVYFDAFFRLQLRILKCTHNLSKNSNEIRYATVVICTVLMFFFYPLVQDFSNLFYQTVYAKSE